MKLALLVHFVLGQMCFKSNLDREYGATGCLDKHNSYRSRQDLQPLDWDPKLAESATRHCKTLVGRGLQHSQNRNNVGENLAIGGGSCVGAVEMWMKEPYRNEPIGSNLHDIGHHSQVMWRRTTKVGCGTVQSYTCCQYYPAGNSRGQRAW